MKKTSSLHGLRGRFMQLYKSTWFFPAILIVLLLGLTALRISGTSEGVYSSALYGQNYKDPNLLFGQPRTIRSDEWLWNTQMIIAQSQDNFQHINHNISTGKDMSLIIDAPYKDWSMVFKPQNLIFFVLPLEYAFAFKWWLLLVLLIISCYFFVLKLLPGKRLLAALLALGFSLNPFIFWWYQNITIAPLIWGFFALILIHTLLDRIRNQAKLTRTDWGLGALLAYVITCFALVLYPPFQIPVILAVLFWGIGYFIQQWRSPKSDHKALLRKLGIIAASTAVALVFVALFYLTRADAIKAIMHTVYPGSRDVLSGGLTFMETLTGFVSPMLQSDGHSQHFFANQSAAANFVLFAPFLFVPSIVLLWYSYKQTKKLDWLLVAVNAVLLLFFVRAYVPINSPLYNLLLLNKVTQPRLVLGFGFAGFLQLVLFIRQLQTIKIRRLPLYVGALVVAVATAITLLFVGKYIHHHYPLYITQTWLIALLALGVSGITGLFVANRPYIASTLLVIFCFGSIFRIHPLYQGLGVVTQNNISKSIRQLSKPGDTWISVDNIYFENYGFINGQHSLSGIQTYPDLKLWDSLDKKSGDSYIYNRYAHVIYSSTPLPDNKNLQLQGPDFYRVYFQPCSSFTKKNITMVLSATKLPETCLLKEKTLSYPAMTLYMYRVKH